MEEGTRRPTPDHPPYSEMVQCALRDLAEVNGSTEPAISDYIRAHYDSLPWAHSRLLPYYLHKLILSGEITRSPLPNRYSLPSNPNPNTPRKRGRPRNPNRKPKPVHAPPNRGRGRPRKTAPPEPTCRRPEPVSKPGPRLILKLKRSDTILVDPQGGVYAGSGWRCLRDNTQEQGEGLGAGEGEGESDVVAADVPEEDFHGITIDEHYDELLALRESDMNGSGTDRNIEEFMALRDDELDGITIDEIGKDFEGVESKEHAKELSVMQEKDSDGVGIHGSNDGLLAPRENDLNDKGLISLRGEELNHFTVDGLSKDLTGGKGEEDAEELSVIQEKDSGDTKIDPCLMEPDQGTPHKKAKPRKSRRLWYES